jgi:hypothetical protein
VDSRVGAHATPVHLSAGTEHLDLQALTTHPTQRPVILREGMDLHYHLRYHLWMRVYGDLTTSPQGKKPADKGQTGLNGSPRTHRTYRYESEGRRFESCRAHYKMPANAAFLPLGMGVKIGLYHPFDHFTYSKRLRRVPVGAV